jgi:transaldolase
MTSQLNSLEQLRKHTTVVVDSADFGLLKKYRPQDVTTNPLHILAATKLPKFNWIIENAARYGVAKSGDPQEQVEQSLLHLLVTFGTESLKHIPGRTSTEVDAIHSFDKEATIRVAREIVALYEAEGISKERVLIKIVATWEGLQAARVLEREYGIHTNMTAIFSLAQAMLAAEAGCTLISPFVARKTDWYYANRPQKDYTGFKGPGVKLVADIFHYYKTHGIKTEIMAASLRTLDEVSKLSGLELMTLNVATLEELRTESYPMTLSLDTKKGKRRSNQEMGGRKLTLLAANMVNGSAAAVKPIYLNNEKAFRMALFIDHAASYKTDEAIRIFLDAGEQTNKIIKAKIDTL